MNYEGFCGSSNQAQSLLADTERTLKLYFEPVQSRYAPASGALYRMPGRRSLFSTADVGGRGSFTAAGRAFHVIGGWLYESFAVAPPVRLGAVAQDNNPAQFAYNSASGGQLVVSSGKNAYHYNLTSGVFTQVLTNECTMIGAIDGRFLAFNIVTGQVRLSALNDGTTWTAQFFARSAASDRWQAMAINGSQIWMIGEETGEVWFNSGASPQPFAENRTSLFQFGTCAPFSVRVVGDSVVWIMGTRDGVGRIIRAQGYNPTPISNYAAETALARYARTSTLADAEVVSFEHEGHLFAEFSFPSAQATWGVDMDTGAWHELSGRTVQNVDTVWPVRAHCYAFNKHLVVDRTTGNISELSADVYDDLGMPIRCMRIGPPLWANSRQRIIVSRFTLNLEPGLGLTSGQGSDPMIMFANSQDAKTWSAERQGAMGRLGQYNARVFWTQIGSSEKLWVPKVTMTDPVPLRIAGAEIEGTGFALEKAA